MERISGAVDDGGAGVVAGGLDREDHERVRSIQPHDQGVLAVVLVVARTHAGRAEAELLVHRDRVAVGDPHLEREGQLVRRPPRSAVEIRRLATPAPAPLRRHGDVHHVPDAVVAGADEVAEQLVAGASRRGRCPTAWRARARTSPATRAPGRSGARSRSPPAGRCRRAAAPAVAAQLTRLLGESLAHATVPHRGASDRSGRREPDSPSPVPAPRGRRCAARRRGARGRRRPASRPPDSSAAAEIVPRPIRPPAPASGSAAIRSASSSGVPSQGPQSRSPLGRVERRRDLAPAGIEDGEAAARRRPPRRGPAPSASRVPTPLSGRPRAQAERPRAWRSRRAGR